MSNKTRQERMAEKRFPIQPTGKRVAVKIPEDEESMIVLPDGEVALRVGKNIEVVAVGPEVTYCAPGDKVAIDHNVQNGQEIEHGGEKVIMLNEHNIIAVLKGE